jgi:hypothetical protein
MSSYHTVLPNTGLGISVLGYSVGGLQLLLVALALIAVGAGLIRFTWRRDSPVSAR